jgi:hypothetical protein
LESPAIRDPIPNLRSDRRPRTSWSRQRRSAVLRPVKPAGGGGRLRQWTRAGEFGGSRNLEHCTPAVQVDRCQGGCLLWCGRRGRKPTETSLPLSRSTTATRLVRLSPSIRSRAHTGVDTEKLKSEADHQSFEYVPLAIGLRLTKQRDHPFVRSQAQCVLFPASFLPTVVLPDPGRPTSKIIVATYRFWPTWRSSRNRSDLTCEGLAVQAA